MSAIEQCRSAALGDMYCVATLARGADRLQLLPQPALPEVPGACRTALARGAAGRSAAAGLLPSGVHLARADQCDRLLQQAIIYDLLFAVAAETLRTIAADPKHLGAQVGVTLVLHTWGSALTHHPHVHGIVPGGGLSVDGEHWVACRPGFFLPVRVLSRLFRRRFLEELQQAHRGGQLQFFGEDAGLSDPRAFTQWLAPLREANGSLCQTPVCRAGGHARLPVPLHPSRGDLEPAVTRARRTRCHLSLEDYRARERHATDDDARCRRFLAASCCTFCPAAFTAFANTACSPMRTPRASRPARELLHVVPTATESHPPEAAAANIAPTFVCPHCGAAMIIVEIFARGQPIRAPPLWRAAA